MRLVAVLLVVAAGCGKQEQARPAPAPGSGSAATDDPWAKPATVPADAAAAACNDADIQAHIESSLASSLTYLGALEAKARGWSKDCERVRKDLLALEPDAAKFMASMQDFMTWGRALDPACGKRVAELGDQRPETRDIEARTPPLEAKITPILERCQKHPGFADAAAKGLRVMQRKKPAP
jgi:hypothetical protein